MQVDSFVVTPTQRFMALTQPNSAPFFPTGTAAAPLCP